MMNYKMQFLFFLLEFLLIACSKPNLNKNGKEITDKDEWQIVEHAIEEKWTLENVKNILGEPREILQMNGNKNGDSYLYYNEHTGVQVWAFGFDENKIINNITYLPRVRGKSLFLNDLLTKWSHFNCIKKTEPSKIPHVVMNHKYLSCRDGKIKVSYNIYEEVESIWVKK